MFFVHKDLADNADQLVVDYKDGKIPCGVTMHEHTGNVYIRPDDEIDRTLFENDKDDDVRYQYDHNFN